MRFLASFSGGKDSYLSIRKMMDKGDELTAIIVSTKKDGTSWAHNIEKKYFEDIAIKLGCDVIFTDTDVETYEENFELALMKGKELGAEVCIFGDIDCKQHLEWNEERCKNVGIGCIMPLVYMNRLDVVEEFLKLEIEAIITKVDESKLSSNFVGEKFDRGFINKISCIPNIDLCGENGEYHTRIILK